jgi:tetratricopeptide (TPR) repeat protein
LLQEAVPLYRKAIELNSNFYDAYINLANAYGELGRIDLSLKTIEKVVALEPDKYEVYYNLGHYLKISGDFDRAKNAYSKSLEINPYSAPTHHGLASLTKYSENTEHLNTLEKIAGNKLLEGDKELIHFALAKAYEDLGDNQKAFVEYKTANNIRNDKVGYDHNLQLKLIETIIENNDLLKSISIETDVTKTAPKPIFILGMPRSGTTLVEQIISSHSTIAPAGELQSVQLFNGLLAEAKVHISEMQISLFRKSYLRELDQYRNGEEFVTDKLPHNFMSIALIRCAFPESPIVHVKRDRAATCWSNYKQAFTKNSLKYSYNLENTVNFYHMYENLMDFWYDEYPDKIYTLEYEKLVNNTDHETKKLIDYIGVGWEEACLKPHLNKRNVKTASQSQVRKKIYSGSSEQWKKFEPFLDGAFDKLIHK